MSFRFTSNRNCHFSSEKRRDPKLIVDFLQEKAHSEKRGNHRGLRRTSSQQQGKTWESSRILRVKPKNFGNIQRFRIFHFSCFSIFCIFQFVHFLRTSDSTTPQNGWDRFTGGSQSKPTVQPCLACKGGRGLITERPPQRTATTTNEHNNTPHETMKSRMVAEP